MNVEEALITVTDILNKKSLNDLQETIFRCAWAQKSYPEIAEISGYDAEYIKLAGFRLWKLLSEVLGEKVTKNNFRSALKKWQLHQERSHSSSLISASLEEASDFQPLSTEVAITLHQDWGEAIDISIFYGRFTELAILAHWIEEDRCKLITILGIGGTGKTALSVKIAEQLQHKFDFIIWRSLHNAPSLNSILTSLIHFLSNYQEINFVEDFDAKVSLLLSYLNKYRCLIVFDNVESILCSANTDLNSCQAGHYLDGYENYGKLFKRVAEVSHRSCLLITSREKPKEVASLEGKTFPVRSLHLSGLNIQDAREIFRAKGDFIGLESDWEKLIQFYAGNPLALKIIATTINELFAGDIHNFLAQNTVIFGDIQDLLDRQFNRLSGLEKELMFWLAINREPIALSQLQIDILSPVGAAQLIVAMESLTRRSLIERGAGLFTLQPVLMEYASNYLITQVCQEIETKTIFIYKSHALIKAQVKDYIQNIQIQIILKPIINRLLQVFGSPKAISDRLTQIVASLQGKLPQETGYAGGNTLNLLCRLQINLSNYDFSRLTIWQADLKGINLHKVDFSYSDLAKSTFTENIGYIFAMAVSCDGLLATADSYSNIRLWRIADGQQLLNWEAHKGWIRSLTFSPDGKTLTSGSDDQIIKLWNVSTGECGKILSGHAGWVLYVAFSPQGDLLASGGEDITIKIWDVSTGECYQTLQGHTGWVCYVSYSPDGQTIASGSIDTTIRLWNVNTGQCLKTLQGHQDKVGFVTFTADSQTLISASEDQTIKLWNVETGKCEKTLPGGQNDWIWWSAVALSNDNKLAIGSRDKTIKLWNIHTSQLLKTLHSHSGTRTIVFSPDSKTLIASHEDQTLKLWDVSSGKCLKTFQGYSSGVWVIALSFDGQTLVSGGADQIVRLWRISDNKCLKVFKGHTDLVRSVAYSPQGDTLASSSADKTVKLWDVADGRCIKTFVGHTNWVVSVNYNPQGNTLATASLDQTVRFWDINSGKCLKILQSHDTLTLSATYNPQGNILASSGADNLVKLWDIDNGQCLKVLQGHTNWVWCTTFSGDGSILASSSADYTVRLWDNKTGQCLNVLQGHSSWVVAIAFSPDNQILASGSLDHTVRLWDVATGKQLKVFHHSRWVLAVCFTYLDTGLAVVSSSDDRTIAFWDIETEKCIKTLSSNRPYEGMNITGVLGINETQKLTLKALGAVYTSPNY